MNGLTTNEMKIILKLFKDFNSRYNANNLSKTMGITPMGTLKILKKLHEQRILKQEVLGKAAFYSIDFNSDYSKSCIKFLLHKEAQESIPRVKRWVSELEKLEPHAEIVLLFGSVLRSKEFNDIDVLLVIKEKNLNMLKNLIKEIDIVNVKKIHPVLQTTEDMRKNITGKDEIVLEALKRGIVLHGYDKFVEVISNFAHRQ